jgi:DNA-binding GntR family transcriptional regulator
MTVQDVKTTSLGDEVFQRILSMIYSSEIAPGEVIKESRIAEAFGVSRGPVREAVRRLQGLELVSREPFQRARVVELTPKAMLDLFQMREALEGYAARLAAERIRPEAAQDLLQGLEATQTGAAFDFHSRVAETSGNRRLISALCGDLYHLLRIFRMRSGAEPERKSAAFEEHWQIARAIASRDADLSESLMRSHIRRATERLQKA